MAALWNRAGHYIFALWFLLLSSIYYLVLFFLAHSQLSQIGCLPYFLKWCGLSADLGCMSEKLYTMCASMADIQSATAEIRRGKTKIEEETTSQKYNVRICYAGRP